MQVATNTDGGIVKKKREKQIEEESIVERIVSQLEEAVEAGGYSFNMDDLDYLAVDENNKIIEIDEQANELSSKLRKLTTEERKEIRDKYQENSRLNKPITNKFLLKFTIPTIFAFVIMGIFGLIDGIFASRVIGEEAMASVGYIMPFFTFAMALGTMLTMGGCALVVKMKGKNLKADARGIFTMLAIVIFSTSAIIAIVSWFIQTPLLNLLGTPDDATVRSLSLEYLRPLIFMMPFLMLGMYFTQFLIAEGRPVLGMLVSVASVLVSSGLNALFLLVFNMGIMGLSLATGIGFAVPTVLGLIYFTFNRKGAIYFAKPKWDIRALGRSAFNGISEMITMMAGTVTAIVMNNVLTDIIGWHGVFAASIVMAMVGIFASLYFGYSSGVAPIVSYNYGKKLKYGKESTVGAERHANLQKLYKKSLVFVIVLSLLAFVLTQGLADLLVRIYVDPGYFGYWVEGGGMYYEGIWYEPGRHYFEGWGYYEIPAERVWECTGIDLHALSVRGLRIVAIGFMFMSFNVFATAWFTAFNNGLVSGIMSFLQTFVFSLALIVGLSQAFALNGVWAALPLVEVLSFCVSIFFLIKLGSRYGYLRSKKKKEV